MTTWLDPEELPIAGGAEKHESDTIDCFAHLADLPSAHPERMTPEARRALHLSLTRAGQAQVARRHGLHESDSALMPRVIACAIH